MLFCLIAAVAWGISFPVMGKVLLLIDPFNFTALRYGAVSILMLAILLYKEGGAALRLRGERYMLAWALGSCGFCGYGFLIFHGQQLAGQAGALSASAMIATTPMLTLLMHWAIRDARPSAASFCCIGLSFLGVLLVASGGELGNLLHQGITANSAALLLLGAASWALYTLGASFFPGWSGYRYTALTTALGLTTVLLSTFALQALGYIQRPTLAVLPSLVPYLGYMVLIAGVLAVLCWNLGNKMITPNNGVLFLDAVPVTAFAVEALAGTPIASGQLLGAACTAVALLANNLYQRRRLALAANQAKVSCR
ncbi:DMT family transporter [Massilia sp. YIM B04103]|uniref:DMT family transporter n=1 Tax=Massilia sp. YIM B04103 TaxID=2963106 RepID=UPI00210AA65E|nr:DMT family transporter [Massilia sp. YIM B04103]